MRLALVLAMTIACAGCAEAEPEEPIDIEQMNRDALGPPVPIELQPMTFEDFEEQGLLGAGCNFARQEGGDILLVAGSEIAAFKRDGEFVTAASDTGSKELPYGAFEKYSGLANAIRIALEPESGQQQAPELTYYRGSLTITDEYDRPALKLDGVWECGA